MKNISTFAAGSAALINALISPNLSADSNHSQGPIRPDSHAPIGVMGDHMHNAGEWMLSLRTMSMKMEGHRDGEDKLTNEEVFSRGFDVAAQEMDMKMHMLGLMYAPSDRITLMAMSNYVESDMLMMSNPNAGMDQNGGHGGHGMGHQGMFSHSTSGWGDISLASLVRIQKFENRNLHLNLGVSIPTGSVSEKMSGIFQPYGMQLGSGTWDAKIGATYSGGGETIGWGAQALGIIRLEDAGKSGFGRSDALEASFWSSYRVATPLSLSGRVRYSAEGPLQGHYNGPHGHAAPPHFQANYGGDVVEFLFGANFVFQDGPLRGNRLALEYGLPLYQQLNGVGMSREETLTLGWQLAW